MQVHSYTAHQRYQMLFNDMSSFGINHISECHVSLFFCFFLISFYHSHKDLYLILDTTDMKCSCKRSHLHVLYYAQTYLTYVMFSLTHIHTCVFCDLLEEYNLKGLTYRAITLYKYVYLCVISFLGEALHVLNIGITFTYRSFIHALRV